MLKCCNNSTTRLTNDSESYEASTPKDNSLIAMDSSNNNAVATASPIVFPSFEDTAVDDLFVEQTSLNDTSRECQSVQAHTTSVFTYSPTDVAEFVETLKETDIRTFGNGTLKQTGVLVVEFDSSRFIQYCDKASPDYNPDYCDYEEISRHLFQSDEVWISRELLIKAMDLLAKYHGFTIRLDKEYIKCNRQGTDKTKRAYVNGPLHAGCTFQFKIASLETERYMPADSPKLKWRYKKRWDRPIKIIDGCCTHGSACQPGKQNRVNTSQRARKYMNNMPKSAIYTLCNYMENLGRLDSNLITNIMKPIWPRAKEFSKYDVFNVRVKVMRLLPVYRRVDGDYEQFKEVVNAGHLLDGIENEIDIDDDEAYELAQSLWLEVSGSSVSKEGELFSFIEYLELIKSKAKGFAYQLAEMPSNTSQWGKKLIGVIWQTSTMRRNFELFGDFVGLDMMKRGINTLLWPYFSLAMYDEMKKVCIGCEGILCGEREDMYQFACNFMKSHCPGRSLSDVGAVAADGFFDQDLVQKLGFVNAHFILDQWHLLDSGLVKIFGKSGYELLQGYLVKMVKSESEEDFLLTSELALQRLQNIIPMNGDLEAKLVDFIERRPTYASHLLAKIPGNRGLHGNACSEQNHWSVISHLNPGSQREGTPIASIL